MMSNLTEEGRRVVAEIANRRGFSTDATAVMLSAVAAGYGSQAQFSHPEFGGMGQWSAGGMIMIGDMFNNALAGRVSALCEELAGLVRSQQMFAPTARSQSQFQGQGGQLQAQGTDGVHDRSSGGEGPSLFVAASSANWWPAELGSAGSTGAQNSLRYAYFPSTRRLAIDVNGVVTVYDTGEHLIGGFSQQQAGDQSITFTSQFGLVRVSDLPVVNGVTASAMREVETPVAAAAQATTPVAPITQVASSPMSTTSRAGAAPTDEIFGIIEKLADLHAKGILTDEEFGAKKSELLGRL